MMTIYLTLYGGQAALTGSGSMTECLCQDPDAPANGPSSDSSAGSGYSPALNRNFVWAPFIASFTSRPIANTGVVAPRILFAFRCSRRT